MNCMVKFALFGLLLFSLEGAAPLSRGRGNLFNTSHSSSNLTYFNGPITVSLLLITRP